MSSVSTCNSFNSPNGAFRELLDAGDPLLRTLNPRYDWERVNQYGEISKYTFIVHRYITENLTEVFEGAKAWYENILDWLDASNDALDFLSPWEKRPDDLPN